MRVVRYFLFVSFLTLLCASTGFCVDFFKMGKVDIHGFVSQGALGSSDNNFFADTDENGTFQFNEVGLNFTTQVNDRLRVGAQILARDLGTMGNKEMTIDWAFADYAIRDWLNLKVGKVKLSYGLYNTSRDVDMLRTYVFLPQSVYNEGWRDTINALSGASLYGFIPVGPLGNLTYYIQGGVADMDADNGAARMLQDQPPPMLNVNIISVNMDYTYATNFIWEPFDGTKIGGGYWGLAFAAPSSYLNMPDTPGGPPVMTFGDFDLKMDSYVGFAECALGDLTLTGEYMTSEYEMTLNGSPHMDGYKLKAEGYYGAFRYRASSWFEVGGYYSEYYPNKEDKEGETATFYEKDFEYWLKDSCVAIRFDINEHWIVKLEGHYMDGAAIMFRSDDNMGVNEMSGMPESLFEQYWELYALKFSFNF